MELVHWIVTLLLLCLTLPSTTLGGNYGLKSVGIPVNEFRCTQTGFFPHPQSRQKFYECVRHPADYNRLISYTYTCYTNECFDMESKMKCSVEACARNATDEFSCLKMHLKQDARLTCQEETLTLLERQMAQMVAFTASRGNPHDNLLLSLRDSNWDMRQNYAKMIENVGKNVYPLMVATDGEPDYLGVGGVFKIYFKDGTMKRIIPVSSAFEMYKSLSHLVLGVFAIVSPYFHNPNSINWQQPLRNFQQHSRNIQFLIQKDETGIVGAERRLALTMLRKTIIYIDDAIKLQSVNLAGYHTFATEMAPFIEESMGMAAKAHAQDTIPALQKLKAEMGEEEWKKLFVIIPTVWPVSLYNIRLQALEKVMSFDQIKNQVLIVEGARTEADARTTLGRIIADRALAQLVFGGLEEPHFKDHVFSLSTRRDLLSSTVSIELNKVCQSLENEPTKPKCPFAGRSSKGILENEKPPLMATMLRS